MPTREEGRTDTQALFNPYRGWVVGVRVIHGLRSWLLKLDTFGVVQKMATMPGSWASPVAQIRHLRCRSDKGRPQVHRLYLRSRPLRSC